MKRLKLSLIGGLALGFVVIADTAYACTRVFENPTVEGYPLDYCREWGTNCGWPAANAYCQSQGYSSATHFFWGRGNQKTRIINGGQVCDSDYCGHISQVTCKE